MEVAILIGVPAAGKSSFCRARLGGHVVISKDLMPSVRDRNARQLRLIEAALEKGRDVAVDNTNPSRAVRAPILELARRCGARVVAYYFPVDVPTAIARNAGREGRARVPAVAIHTARKQLEPPARDEGFDDIIIVP